MTENTYRVRKAHWPEDVPALRAVREPVFVQEQAVPLNLEWDEDDPLCTHVLAVDDTNAPIGTGRLDSKGKIGRMAVLQPWRGKGVGADILQALLNEARHQGMPECHLHAQVSALGFYERFGFSAEGPEFDEAGIAHQMMRIRFKGAEQ